MAIAIQILFEDLRKQMRNSRMYHQGIELGIEIHELWKRLRNILEWRYNDMKKTVNYKDRFTNNIYESKEGGQQQNNVLDPGGVQSV